MPMPEVPTLTFTKSTSPAASSRAAISAASSGPSPEPSRISSSPTRRTPTASPLPTAARTACSTSTQKRMRPSRSPPYSSVRRLLCGDRNSWIKYPCAAWISTPSRPAAAQFAAERANPSITDAISWCSIALGGSM